VRNFVHPLLLSVRLPFRNHPFRHFSDPRAAVWWRCARLGLLPWRRSSVPASTSSSRIAHATPAQANRPAGLRSPQFSKSCRKEPFQKIGSPEEIASNPILLALVVPLRAPTPCAKGIRRAFQRSAGGQLLKARQAKSRLGSGCGSARRRRRRKERKKGD